MHLPHSGPANSLNVDSKIKLHIKLLCLFLLCSRDLSLRLFDKLCVAVATDF